MIDDIRELSFELPMLASAEGNTEGAFPQGYVAGATHQRYYPANYNCGSAAVALEGTLRLDIRDRNFGTLRVSMSCFDRYGNFPGRNSGTVAGDVALHPGNQIYLVDHSTGAWVKFYGVDLNSRLIKWSMGMPFRALSDGRVCHRGEISLPARWWTMTRVSLSEFSTNQLLPADENEKGKD
jgi:hypothetical protein